MDNDKLVDQITDLMAEQVSQGLLLKNVRRRLSQLGHTEEALNKLVRIVEIKSRNFMHYAAH